MIAFALFFTALFSSLLTSSAEYIPLAECIRLGVPSVIVNARIPRDPLVSLEETISVEFYVPLFRSCVSQDRLVYVRPGVSQARGTVPTLIRSLLVTGIADERGYTGDPVDEIESSPGTISSTGAELASYFPVESIQCVVKLAGFSGVVGFNATAPMVPVVPALNDRYEIYEIEFLFCNP